MRSWFFVLTLLSTLGSSLMAGTFFSFSVLVMPALTQLPANQAIAAMQSINLTAVTPLFMLVFLGTTLLIAILVVVTFWQSQSSAKPFLVVGGLFYIVGVFLITAIFNVPLNDSLATLSATDPVSPKLWDNYANPWNIWNHLRAVSSLAATLAFVLALVRPSAT